MARPKSTNPREKKTTSFKVYTDTKRKLDYISMMDNKDLSDIADEGFNHVIQKFEKKNGPIPVKQ